MTQALAEMVRDNLARSRFELDVDGATAFTTYRRAAQVVTLLHAEVPAAQSGRGIGSAMVAGVLALLRAGGDKVIPRCPFIARYMSRHPEVQDLLADPGALASG